MHFLIVEPIVYYDKLSIYIQTMPDDDTVAEMYEVAVEVCVCDSVDIL